MIEGEVRNDFFETFDEVVDNVHEIILLSQASFNSAFVQLRIVIVHKDETICRSMMEFYAFFKHE